MKNGIPPQIILLLTLLFGVWGCGGEKASRPKDSIACVGGECLTERDLEYRIPEAYREKITLEEKKGYVRSWIENEILYQEAKNERFDQDKRIQSLLNQRIRETIVQEFVEAKLKDKIRISGNIEVTAVEESFKIPGRVATRLVDEGALVKAGQVIARLESDDFINEVALRQADLQAMQAALDELLAGARKEEIAQAEAALAAVEAEAKRLADDFHRQEALWHLDHHRHHRRRRHIPASASIGRPPI